MMLPIQSLTAEMLKEFKGLEDLVLLTEIRLTRADTYCGTAFATFDGKEPLIVFNEKFMGDLSPKEQVAVCIHEFFHLLFGHLHTHLSVDGHTKNIMADVLINALIKDLPSSALTHKNIATHIFGSLLTVSKDSQKLFEPLVSTLAGEGLIYRGYWPACMNPAPYLHLSQLIRYFEHCKSFLRSEFGIELDMTKFVTLDGAAAGDVDTLSGTDSLNGELLAKILDKLDSGTGYGNASNTLARYLKQEIYHKNKVPWQTALRDAILGEGIGSNVPSWRRPSRRFGLLSSGKRSIGISIVVIIDTSASILARRFGEIAKELQGLVSCGLVDLGFPIIYGDTTEAGISYFDGDLDAKQCRGGGGTDMSPLVAFAAGRFGLENTFIVLTDGEIPEYVECGVPHDQLVWLVDGHKSPDKSLMPGMVIDVRS